MTIKKPITRFAPSPTGYLHIGGARTALFNWLFARRHGGTFRLRVEDTDKQRSTQDATQAILDGMAWLGLKADGDIVFQSQNADRHVRAAHALIENGAAYRCYATSDEVEQLRADAREAGTAFRSPWRDNNSLPNTSIGASDNPSNSEGDYVVRFRVPGGETRITDHVQGEIVWQNDQFDDLVLLRADGTPTYMLAVIVDDHDMGITHVIRGDDHLINAGRQTLIYQGLNWDVPEWAHVPLIHGPDGKKLSKRHGALGVEAYREMGYLPEGLRNYLLKLGWSHGDQELFFGDEAQNKFDLDGLNSSPARLDFEKMDFVNAQHIAQIANEDLLNRAKPFIEAVNDGPLEENKTQRILAAMDSLKPRAKTLKDLAEQATYLILNRPIELNSKARKSLKNDAIVHLKALTLRLEAIQHTHWNENNIQQCLQEYVSETEVGFGKVGQPVRAALTGGAPAPDLSLVMALLGAEETIGRISDATE